MLSRKAYGLVLTIACFFTVSALNTRSKTSLRHGYWTPGWGGLDRQTYGEDYMNPFCGFCKVIMNGLNANPGKPPESMCKYVAFTKKEACEVFAKTLAHNSDVKLLATGCTDTTTSFPKKFESNKCPGLVACNILEAEN